MPLDTLVQLQREALVMSVVSTSVETILIFHLPLLEYMDIFYSLRGT